MRSRSFMRDMRIPLLFLGCLSLTLHKVYSEEDSFRDVCSEPPLLNEGEWMKRVGDGMDVLVVKVRCFDGNFVSCRPRRNEEIPF
jgi:hypothetical protein